MVEATRSSGAIPVLLTRPFTGPLASVPSWKHAAPAYNAATLSVARSEGVEAIDLYGASDGQDLWFSDEAHYSELGHRTAAAIVYERLRAMVPGEDAGRRTLQIRSWPHRLRGFHLEASFPKWTAGDGIIGRAGLSAGAHARWLAVDTYGWRRGTAASLGLRVEIDGRGLRFSHRDGDAYLFELPDATAAFDTVRIRSSTFRAAVDPRWLGLDVRALRVVDDRPRDAAAPPPGR
jgi:hypothetical protein